MKIITFLLLLGITVSVHAEAVDVYTCYTSSKSVVFQATPCSSGEKQSIVKIPKRSPEQVDAAEKELDKVTTERARQDEIEQAQRKAVAAEVTQREVAEAKQAAEAARNEAAAARLDAEKARQAAIYNPYPVIIYDNYGNRNRQNNYNYHHDNNNSSNNNSAQKPIPSNIGVSPFPTPQPMSPSPRWRAAP